MMTTTPAPGPFPRPLTGLPDLDPAILIERWICPKADFDHMPYSRAWLRAQWWDIRGLVAIWYRLADRCPHITTGTALVRIAVRANEFTIDHRPIHLRHLIAACPICPHADQDSEPLP